MITRPGPAVADARLSAGSADDDVYGERVCRAGRGREHRWAERLASDRHGVTLVELLIVLVVIAVFSGTAISLLSSGHGDMVADEAVKRLVTDLEFAQSSAIAHRAERRVVFDENGESYGVYEGATLLWHPVSKRPFRVDLGEIYRGGALDLDAPDFGGSDTLRFNAQGVPVTGGTVWIKGPGGGWSIQVASGTGHITVAGG